MKRLVSVLIAFVLLLGTSQTAVFAYDPKLPLRVVVNQEREWNFKAEPMMHEGVMYVPVDFFKDSLNVPVTQKDHEVEVTVRDNKINFSVGEKYVYLDDVKTNIDKPTYLGEDGTIFIPLGIFCKLLGVEYEWEDSINSSYVTWDENAPEAKVEDKITLPAHQNLSAAAANGYGERNANALSHNRVIFTEKYHYFTSYLSYKKSTISRYDVKTKQTKVIFTDKNIFALSHVGNYLYYLGDANDNKFHQAYTFYRVKLDGTGKTRLSSADMARFYVIDDGWFYFSNWNDDQKLYKMKLDGTQLTKISDIEVDHQISVWGDYLIFIDGDNNMTFISKTSGKVLSSYSSTSFRDFVVYNDAIYLSTFGDGIEKVSLASDVVKKEIIMVEGIDTWGDSLWAMNFSGDTIYYSGDADKYHGTSKIRSIKTDGSQSKVFLNAPKGYYIEDMTIVGQTMYYTAAKSLERKIVARSLYRVNLSTPTKSVLISKTTVK